MVGAVENEVILLEDFDCGRGCQMGRMGGVVDLRVYSVLLDGTNYMANAHTA